MLNQTVIIIKQETMEAENRQSTNPPPESAIISLSSRSGSSSCNSDGLDSDDSDLDDWVTGKNSSKKQKIEPVLPVGFLDPLTPEERLNIQKEIIATNGNNRGSFVGLSNVPIAVKLDNYGDSRNVCWNDEAVDGPTARSCRQFWKAGDYYKCKIENLDPGSKSGGMDHVRIHPKFLHSNATSHKWALGAFAELLDNAFDEVSNGATYVHVDVLKNNKDDNTMLLIEDNGGGMTPDKLRKCMSLGYSEKSRIPNTIGQYGNGFKTSTMRLGADVIVFSRCKGTPGQSATQSVGLLSYTFLMETGKEDTVVPMIDYENSGNNAWNKLVRFTSDDWQRNLKTIVQWSPFRNEDDLLQQFNFLNDQGTRIIIYNLWEDDQGVPELDFDTDQHDIQIRGASRDEKKIEMAKDYPNSRHFLTYRHSLRNYASILYLRLPPNFQMTLRGKEIEHHNIVDDMMLSKQHTYRPVSTEATSIDPDTLAVVTLGFVKDAKSHIDVQGFNVYHKNRLIKPFWRVWNAAGSDGRGVIGVLEANFVEPAHDKQGFERTATLSRLEARLNAIQKNYWTSNCHLIGYAARRQPKKYVSPVKEACLATGNSGPTSIKPNGQRVTCDNASTWRPSGCDNKRKSPARAAQSEAQAGNSSNTVLVNGILEAEPVSYQVNQNLIMKNEGVGREMYAAYPSTTEMVISLSEENQSLKKSLDEVLQCLVFERDRNLVLESQLEETTQKLEKSQVFVTSYTEERIRRDEEEARMRKRMEEASETIDGLLCKVKMLESRRV